MQNLTTLRNVSTTSFNVMKHSWVTGGVSLVAEASPRVDTKLALFDGKKVKVAWSKPDFDENGPISNRVSHSFMNTLSELHDLTHNYLVPHRNVMECFENCLIFKQHFELVGDVCFVFDATFPFFSVGQVHNASCQCEHVPI